MLTDAQLQYVEEVLGVAKERLPLVPVQGEVDQPRVQLDVVVQTDPLSSEESFLLKKILASVQLEDVPCVTDETPARQRLHFGAEKLGRVKDGEDVHWGFPSVASMLGQGPEVSEKKKQTWALLQQFQKERRG